MPSRDELEPAFEATTYVVRPADGPAMKVRLGRLDDALDAWLSQRGCMRAVIITAHNPGGRRAAEVANVEAQAKLERALASATLAQTVAEPDDPGWPVEPGVLVAADDEPGLRAALDAAAGCGQAAVVVLRVARPPELLWLADDR
jgi:hypothetical protein